MVSFSVKNYARERDGPNPGGTPLCKRKGYVPPQRIGFFLGFLALYGLKTGIYFAHSGLESGMVFEGTTGVYDGTCLTFQFQTSKKK